MSKRMSKHGREGRKEGRREGRRKGANEQMCGYTYDMCWVSNSLNGAHEFVAT